VDAAGVEKASAVKLIRTLWPELNASDIRSLTVEDRVQLASGIARNMGLPADALAFVPVEY